MEEIVAIIDKSGSMETIQSDAIGGFNTFLAAQQKVGEGRFTLILFDHTYQKICDGIDLKTATPLDGGTYVPGGFTALLDAVGRTIDEVGQRLADTAPKDRPEKVIVAILTDGLENSSEAYSRQQVFEKITHQQEKYGWEFIFLAANQDAFQTGSSIGISMCNTASFESTGEGVRTAYDILSETVSSYRMRDGTADK